MSVTNPMRKWTSLLAVLGVLLHAGTLVRHHVMMFGAGSPYQALLADLQVICHGAGGIERIARSELPAQPGPTDADMRCPLCAGLVGAYALLAPQSTPTAHAVATQMLVPRPVSTLAELQRTNHPPSRGPPQAA